MIRTERLVLRRFCEDDPDEFLELIRDKQRSEWAAYDAPWPTDEGALRDVLAGFCGDPDWFCIELVGERRCAGFVAAHFSGDGSRCDIGYTVHSAYQRRGIAYEACGAVMRELAKRAALETFTAGTADCNAPSVGLLAKLGFERKFSELVSFAKGADGRPFVFAGGFYECGVGRWRG